MILIWKGKLTKETAFTYPDLPLDAKKLFPEHGGWTILMYLFVIPVLLFAYGGILLHKQIVGVVSLSLKGGLVGIVLALLLLSVHELIHSAFCPQESQGYLYWTMTGLCFIPASPLKKGRYLGMLLMPAVILGILPFLVWCFLPGIPSFWGSALFACSLGSLGMCVGDFYNAVLAAVKMPPDSRLVTSGMDCYILK